jgi:prepilin-type N-terminal cleavage/methylation domain-containing protein
MTRIRNLAQRRRSATEVTAGFTLVELMIALVVTGILTAGLYTLMAVQNRGYSRVRELGDVHSTLRSSAALLGWNLRYTSPAGGDLYSIGPNSIALRSYQGTALICTKDPGGWYGLVRTEGDVSLGADSVLIFAAGTVGQLDDRWTSVGLKTLAPPGGAICDWPSPPVIVRRLHVDVASPADTSGVRVGGPVRLFRSVAYGPFQWNGRWWLGRNVNGLGWEPLAGPMPDSTGLQLRYFDAAGLPTAVPSQVSAVEFRLRAESTRRVDAVHGAPMDSVRMKVHVRG